MPLLFNLQTQRPNRLEDTKNEKFHLQFARWGIGSFSHPLHHRFINKSLLNWAFYKGGDNQWIMEEDLEGFFLDETGGVRNRIKVVRNLIRPMVEQYKGNAIRIEFEARAKSSGDFAINRREQELDKMKFFTRAATQFPEFKGVIQDRAPMKLGETEEQTEAIFDNLFVDDLESSLNMLLEYIADDVDIQKAKVTMASDMAITGLGVWKAYEQNGRYVGNRIDPMYFFFDRTAQEADLSDAEYMGDWSFYDIPTLFERFQNISAENRTALENHSRQAATRNSALHNQYYQLNTGRVPVYEVYFRDSEQQEYGWVLDQFGYELFTRINHQESDFTDKDLIDPSSEVQKKKMKGKKKKKIYVDLLRYCVFVPKEEIGTVNGTDIVLEWGEVPYSEKYRLDPSNVKFPYKCGTWSYDKGDILSPIDDAINPQRFINRMLSVAESHVNNSRGAGSVFSKEAVDEEAGEAGVVAAVNRGEPVFVHTDRVGSVGNAIGQYNSNIGSTAVPIFNVINQMQDGIQATTGVNESMTGTGGTSGALVGVIEQQIQRGSLIQEPFYWALSQIIVQAYQHMATVGKRIYADNPRRIAIITGDAGAQPIVITENLRNEDFRIFVKRSLPKGEQVNNANALLFQLLQFGAIDQTHFADLYGRGTPDDVAKAMREFQSMKNEADRRLQETNAKRAQAIEQEGRTQLRQADAKEDGAEIQRQIEVKEGQEHEIEKIDARTRGQIQKQALKS